VTSINTSFKTPAKTYKLLYLGPESLSGDAERVPGHAQLRDTKPVTHVAIAYVATQVCLRCHLLLDLVSQSIRTQLRFALSSSDEWDSNDHKPLYRDILDLLNDPLEHEEVADLIAWWNKWVLAFYFQKSMAKIPSL